MQHSSDVETQVRLAVQLGQMGKEATPALAYLEKALALDVRVAREAVTALGVIGPAARRAVPALKQQRLTLLRGRTAPRRCNA